jgi:hypothetical protein
MWRRQSDDPASDALAVPEEEEEHATRAHITLVAEIAVFGSGTPISWLLTQASPCSPHAARMALAALLLIPPCSRSGAAAATLWSP